ncbi:secreted antigen 1 [Babesia caballi]|uniref:Secreted antigen 1 n=1 Tax=Babesia caballi TaxID=5871 RepID=A0AAV4M1W2_BABCB|nr:secreted antigen 1 [Babesia caballi]
MNGVLDGLGNDGHKKEPKNLKEALNFLAALSENTHLTAQIAERLKQEAAKYLLEDKLTTGYYAITAGLKNVLGTAKTVREYIVSEQKKKDYETYNDLPHDNNCADSCVAILLELLPKLHATLYYLYFRTDSTLSGRIGGDWAMYKCNEDTEDLCKWFTDASGGGVIADSEEKLLPGGYTGPDELRDTNGHILGEELSNLVDPEAADGYLQKLLFVLSFNISLSRASTAAAVSCIDAFCKSVTSGVFDSDGAYNNISYQLNSICAALPNNLKPLTGGVLGRKFLESLFQDSEKDLVEILRRDAYNSYVGWLKVKLSMLFTFIDEMQKECAKWNPSSIYQKDVVGPFVYGFTYGRRWSRGGSIYEIGPQLVKDIAKLTGSCTSANDGTLAAFWKCLYPTSITCPVPSSTSESPTVNHNNESPSRTVAITTKEKKVEVVSESQGQSSPPTPTAEPVASAYSTSSGAETSADSSATSGASIKHNEQTTHTSNSDDHGTRFQEGGPSGANSSPSCSTGESCPDHTQYGSSEGSSGTEVGTRMGDHRVNNAQSTITIGGATGGAAVLGGGCAALYFLNVGGIKTLITGVP